MCGIVGFIDPVGATPDPERVLAEMSETVSARGPDDNQALNEGPLWVAHRRLAIVATGSEGRQPFVQRDAQGRAEIIALANGELYNHDSLRADLPGPAPGPSDCAILPGLWRRDGERMARSLEGMFAFAIWDAPSGRLLLARDRAGQKPLFYATLPGGGLAFASEPRALLAHPLVDRSVDGLGLRRYLAFDYTFGERTIHAGVRRLPPGHSLVWRDGDVRLERWWDIPEATPEPMDRQTAVTELWTSLRSSVQHRRMADVPLGVFLSGGADSTAIVAALADQADPGDVHTFSIGFDDPSFDESGVARRVAHHFGTTHHERILQPRDLLDEIPEILGRADQPLADPSVVPTTLLSRFARERVKVVLGGDGGDELLLGYPTFLAERVARWASMVPGAVQTGLVEPLLKLLPVSHNYMSLDFKLKRFLSGLDQPAQRRHLVWVGGLHPRYHQSALAAPWCSGATSDELFADVDHLWRDLAARRPGDDTVSRLGWQYFQTYLAEDVLTQVDRASMGESLEVRAPLLDSRLIDLCARMPSRLKSGSGGSKLVLRQMLKERGVPTDIVDRRKQGFAMPVARWLRGPLAAWAKDILRPEEVARGGLLDPHWVSVTLEAHLKGRENHAKALWSALALEVWRRGPYGPGDAGV